MAFENLKLKLQKNKDIKQIRLSTPQTFEFVTREILDRVGLQTLYDNSYVKEIYSKANSFLSQGETGSWIKFLLSDESTLSNKADFLITALHKIKPELKEDFLKLLNLSENKFKIQKNVCPYYFEFVDGEAKLMPISDDMYEFLIKKGIMTPEIKENKPVRIITHLESDWWGAEEKVIYLPVDPLISCGSQTRRKILLDNGVDPNDKYPYIKDGEMIPYMEYVDQYKKYMTFEERTGSKPYDPNSLESKFEQDEKENQDEKGEKGE